MDEPFIGSDAISAGTLTRHELRKYHRAVMPDVYVGKSTRLSPQQRLRAAWLWSRRQAVVAGSSAAALHGAKWIGDDYPVELIWPNARPPRGVITRHDTLLADETRTMHGMTVTTVERTAFDLGRRGRLGDAVARLDALGAATGLKADDVRALAARHPHTRGLSQLHEALDLYDPASQSPKETWLRLLLVKSGFPRPQTQIPVLGLNGYPVYYLDMGWEELKLAVEYDGAQHADALGYDIERHDYIAGLGWTVVRVAAGHQRAGIIHRVQREWNRLTPNTLTLR
jgi:hypothetical protein